eukprot:15440271-Alexandrium_andersonii.AAC.1
MIHHLGAMDPEVTYRTSQSEQAFSKLKMVWRGPQLSTQTKIKVYNACVRSRLLYGLGACWLREGLLARLEAHHMRCLRRLAGIPTTFASKKMGTEP